MAVPMGDGLTVLLLCLAQTRVAWVCLWAQASRAVFLPGVGECYGFMKLWASFVFWIRELCLGVGSFGQESSLGSDTT